MSAESPAAPALAAPSEPAWMRWLGIAVFAGAVAVGGWLRFYDLDLKPLHSDEGVNGWFLMRLFNGLRDFGQWRVNYNYDPTNYHGPFLYFAGLIPFFTMGPTNTTLRVLMAIAGTGCIAVLWPVRKHLGWAGLAMAAWLIAISPPLVYFSRTAIHEMYVAFFTLAAVICLAKCYQGTWKPGSIPFRPNWLLFGCVSAALLFTNKETSIITFASFFGAGVIAWFFSRTSAEEIELAPRAERKRKKDKDGEESAAATGPGQLATFLRWTGALVIGLGPAAILLKFVKQSRSWEHLPADQKTWILVGAGFGVLCGILWIAGTRGETFQIGPRMKRLQGVVRYALGGVMFLLEGPVFLLRWVTDRVPFLAGQRPAAKRLAEKAEAKLPADFDSLSDYALAYAWAIALVVILFTSFFNNPRGAWDMFATYGTWVSRGHEGAGHEKPFGYWIELMWEFDTPILLLGMLGTAVALFRRDRLGLFLASWAWSQWLVYSVISYKTPWLNLNFTLPLAVTGGLALREVGNAIGSILRTLKPGNASLPWVGTAIVTASVPAVVMTWPVPAGPVLSPKDPSATASWWALNWDVNFTNYDDDRYGIIYVQTVREFEELIDQLDVLLRTHGDKLGVWVTSGDYWPMPYYLRDWDKIVGYYQGKIPTGDPPSVVVTSSTQEAEMREKLAGYRRIPFTLRPGVALTLFVEPSIYDPAFGPWPGEAVPDPAPEDPALRAPGLVAEYRYGISCTGEIRSKRVDPYPKYGGRDREFRAPLCVIWKGFIDVKTEGEWAFGTSSDDGSWVYLDGKLVLDNGGTHGAVEREGILRVLTPGPHAIEVRYFDAGGGAALDVWTRKRDEKRTGLDGPGALFHDVRTLEGSTQKAQSPAKSEGTEGTELATP